MLCEEQTLLVIDNYQLILNELSDTLNNFFSNHFNSNFHIVIIIQPLKRKKAINTTINFRKLFKKWYFVICSPSNNQIIDKA